MHKKTIWLFIFTCFFTCFALSSAQAQVPGQAPPRDWEFSFFGGLSQADSHSSNVAVTELSDSKSVHLDYASGYLLGLRITENLGDHVSAELDYIFANQPLAFRDLSPNLPRLDLDHNVHSAVYSVLYSPFKPRSRIRPFGLVGGGVSFFHVAKDSKDAAVDRGVTLKDRWKFLVTFGGGVKYRWNESWGLRFDARDQISGVPDYGLPAIAPTFQNQIFPAFRPDGLIHNWKFSVGVSYYFKGL